MTTLWDTTGTAVVKALAAERRQSGSVSSGLALTLVAVVAENLVSEAEQAATRAAAQHPCRLLVVVRRRPDAPEPRLDAEVSVGGRLGPGEAVVMRMYGRLALHAESVVLPLLAPDAPVVTWWFGEPPSLIAHDPLGVIADRRITDAAAAADPLAALRTRAEDFAPGDTDLSWARTTLWRSLCAAAFDSLSGPVRAVTVAGEATNPSRALLAGWLGSRLSVEVEQEDTPGPGVTGVRLQVGDEEVALSRTDGRTATMSRTGQPDRALPLPRRDLGELLAEELRRLDADETYAESLAAVTATSGLADRPATRTHVWQDPAETADPDPGPHDELNSIPPTRGRPVSARPTVVVHRDAEGLAAATAARLLTRLADAQAARGSASVVLTGGGIGTALLRDVRSSTARAAVDWRRVDVWWGDERFVPADDPERNERQAREALLDDLDLDPARVHPINAADGPDGDDPDAAAERYAALLAGAAPAGHQVPAFDVLLLGMGPEGHTASIFPDSPAAHDERTALAVRDCPKPPSTRITMGFRALCEAREVWMVVAGAGKAAATAAALAGADRVQLPAAGAVGRSQTLWLLDEAAAAELPPGVRDP